MNLVPEVSFNDISIHFTEFDLFVSLVEQVVRGARRLLDDNFLVHTLQLMLLLHELLVVGEGL